MHGSSVPVVEVEIAGRAIVRVGRLVVAVAPVILRTVVEPDDTTDIDCLVDGTTVFGRREHGRCLAARWREIVTALAARTDHLRR